MSLLTIIDNAIENLSLKSKTEIFKYFDSKCPKQLKLIDDELNSIVEQLDAMKNVDGKKSRIIQIQLIQKMIDVVLNIKFSQESSREPFVTKIIPQDETQVLQQLANEQQKNRVLEESIVVKNEEFKKMNTLFRNKATILEQLQNEQRKNRVLEESIVIKNEELEKMNTLSQKNAELDKINTICRNHELEKLTISIKTLKQENESLSQNYHLLESSLKKTINTMSYDHKIESIVTNNEIQHHTCNCCNDKIESLITEKEILKQENESLSKNFMQLQSNLKKRITEIENLTKNITTETQKNKLLNGAIESKNEKILQLQKQINPLNNILGLNTGFKF